MKTRDYINTAIGILIGVAIIFFTVREFVLYDTDMEAVWNASPAIMKALGLVCLIAGGSVVYLIAVNKIAFKSDNKQVGAMIALIIITVLLSWFVANNFYSGIH